MTNEEKDKTIQKWSELGLIAVQPLSAPTPNLYYADFKYKSE